MESKTDRRQRLYRLTAIVLKRRDLGEADRLLTVLARDRGKLTLLARGVRRPASRKAGHIEPFTAVDLLVARSRSFHLITQAEMVAAHRRLREDLWLSAWAYYTVELADAFIQDEDPHELLFDLLRETLDRLEAGSEPALVVRYYELHLLSLAGYQPQLFRCVECGSLLRPETNYFSLERGGALCPQHGVNRAGAEPLALPTLKVVRFLQSRSWQQAASLRLSPGVAAQVEKLLGRFITHHLERTVRSAAFLEQLRRQIAVTAPPGAAKSEMDEGEQDPLPAGADG